MRAEREQRESERRVYQGLEVSRFAVSRSLLGCFLTFLSPCGYFGLSLSERFRMDAIMLQEKLVERLLCPRVRTARQKVKSLDLWEEMREEQAKRVGNKTSGNFNK